MDCTITHTLNILGEQLEIDFQVYFYIENDGIGSYEYGGCSGYDSGSNYPVVEGVEWDVDLFDTYQNAEIKRQTNTTEFDNQITKKINL
jgi:hypothetical protein